MFTSFSDKTWYCRMRHNSHHMDFACNFPHFFIALFLHPYYSASNRILNVDMQCGAVIMRSIFSKTFNSIQEGIFTTRTQDNSYPRQLVPRTTRTQDNSCPGQLIPRTTRTQICSVTRTGQFKTTHTHIFFMSFYYDNRGLVFLKARLNCNRVTEQFLHIQCFPVFQYCWNAIYKLAHLYLSSVKAT